MLRMPGGDQEYGVVRRYPGKLRERRMPIDRYVRPGAGRNGQEPAQDRSAFRNRDLDQPDRFAATRLRLATTPISQPVELPAIRELLTDAGWAQMVIRLGYGPPAAATPRRPLAEIMDGEGR